MLEYRDLCLRFVSKYLRSIKKEFERNDSSAISRFKMAVENNRYRFARSHAAAAAAVAANKMQIRFNIAQAFTLDENFELFAFKRKEAALRNYVIK